MPEINFSEKELEDFLCKGKNLEKYLGLKFVGRQINTAVGIVDILACSPFKSKIFRWHNEEKVLGRQWYIIELKKGKIDPAAYFQVWRYKHYFDRVYNSGGSYGCVRDFIPLLIGSNLDESLNYNVSHFRSSPKYETCQPTGTYYTCFDYSFDRGITFTYCSASQEKIEEEFYEGIKDKYEAQYDRYRAKGNPPAHEISYNKWRAEQDQIRAEAA